MKSRWREHELILVSLLAVIAIVRELWYPFDYMVIPSTDFQRTFLPRALSVLMIYASYYWLSRILIMRLLFPKKQMRMSWRITWSIVQFLVIVYVFNQAINIATYYVRPYAHKYSAYQLQAIFRFDLRRPFNPLSGYIQTMCMFITYFAYACIREFIIYLVEMPGVRRAYRILIINRVTLFPVFLFTISFFILSFRFIEAHPFLEYYYSYGPAPYYMHLAGLYWLFPLKGEGSFFTLRNMMRTIMAGFVCTLPWMGILAMEPEQQPVFLLVWAICVFVVTPLTWLYYQQRKDRILQLIGIQVDLARSKTDLQLLRSQINPHFLFNALNTLYGTALREGSSLTAEGIQKLGDMMRFILDENNQDYSSMQREIEYLQNFISLQQLRIQSSPAILIINEIRQRHYNHRIAPMLLLPFLENAFKHGISLTGRSWIKVSLTCDEKNIHFEVRNSIHNGRKFELESDNNGIGLKNVSERLQLIYPGRHQLMAVASGNEFIAQLSIQP